MSTGGLDPDPPDPGITLRTVAPHAVLVLDMLLATIFCRGDMLLLVVTALLLASAWGAWLLARLDALHRPIAWGLVAMGVCALVREGLHVAVLHGGPYAGWARVSFHVEEATRISTVVIPAWMALATLTKWPPGPSRIRMVTLNAWAVALLVVGTIAMSAAYPSLRGDALRRIYLDAELAALFVAVVAILSWARRVWKLVMEHRRVAGVLEDGWDDIAASVGIDNAADRAALPRWYTYGTVLALVVGDLALLIWGAWRWGLFGDAYVVQQGGLVAVWGTVAAIQGAALVLARRGR